MKEIETLLGYCNNDVKENFMNRVVKLNLTEKNLDNVSAVKAPKSWKRSKRIAWAIGYEEAWNLLKQLVKLKQ